MRTNIVVLNFITFIMLLLSCTSKEQRVSNVTTEMMFSLIRNKSAKNYPFALKISTIIRNNINHGIYLYSPFITLYSDGEIKNFQRAAGILFLAEIDRYDYKELLDDDLAKLIRTILKKKC